MADNVKGEMIRGQIDTVILLALKDGDKDSNDIRTAIEEKSDNQYSIKQGTFYSAMQRLIKQGLIREYRTSALDGIRRKYYAVTAKGDKYLDKNREQWSVSKALVDNLIDAEPTLNEPKNTEQPQKPVDEFDNFKALVNQCDENISIEQEPLDDSYFDSIGIDVLNDLNEELSKANLQNNEPKQVDQPLPLQESENQVNEKLDKNEDNSSNFADDYESISNKVKDELFSFEMTDEEGFENVLNPNNPVEQTNQPPIYEEINNHVEENVQQDLTITNQIVEQTLETNTVEKQEPNKQQVEQNIQQETFINQSQTLPKDSEEDDQLFVEESIPTNRSKYKQILDSLLPKETNIAQQVVNQEEEPIQQTKFDSYEKEQYNNQVDDYTEEDNLQTQTYYQKPYNQQQVNSKVEEEKKQINTDPSDFSDLYNMANREGFKIRTSHNTNKFVGNGILINKLRLHSSLLFFVLLFVEALVLNFALSSILEWKASTKFTILGCLAIYPLISLIIFLFSPKRLVNEVSTFRESIGVALIITFQMAILILCVALFTSVDFNNFKEVCAFILLPFILALNIPIAFILKYSLLSTGKYFTE